MAAIENPLGQEILELDSLAQLENRVRQLEEAAAATAPVSPTYAAIKAGVARLGFAPANWHHTAIFVLSKTAEEDGGELRRSTGPLLFVSSVAMVWLQLACVLGVWMGTMWPPCVSNHQCSFFGQFCSWAGNGALPDRCVFCGSYPPLEYQYDARTGKAYNIKLPDGRTQDPHFSGFNLTLVAEVCSDHSKAVSMLPWIPGTQCFTIRKPNDVYLDILPFDERFEPAVCPGAKQIGESSPRLDEFVTNWCSQCVDPLSNAVMDLDGHDIAMNNVENMQLTDWLAYGFCSLLVTLAIVGEIKDIQLCLYALGQASERLPKHWRIGLRMIALVRRWAFLPWLLMSVVTLVVYQGGSALQVCFNSVAILFVW